MVWKGLGGGKKATLNPKASSSKSLKPMVKFAFCYSRYLFILLQCHVKCTSSPLNHNPKSYFLPQVIVKLDCCPPRTVSWAN